MGLSTRIFLFLYTKEKELMKIISKLISLSLIVFFISSCIIGGIDGNGNVIKQNIKINSDFTAINVSQGIDVFLTLSKNTDVEAEIDENLFEFLEIVIENNTLKISFSERIGKRTKTAIYVSMPSITALSTSSAAEITSTNQLKVEDIILKASSGSEIELNIIAKSISAEASSGSEIEIIGETDDLLAESSSGSDIEAKNLMAKNVIADASSGSDITVQAIEGIKAEASSGSDIDCEGNPTNKDISESSGGDVSVK